MADAQSVTDLDIETLKKIASDGGCDIGTSRSCRTILKKLRRHPPYDNDDIILRAARDYNTDEARDDIILRADGDESECSDYNIDEIDDKEEEVYAFDKDDEELYLSDSIDNMSVQNQGPRWNTPPPNLALIDSDELS